MSKGPGPGIGSNTGMDTAHTIDHRLTELEIKSSYAEDLLDTLNQTIFRQQEQIEMLIREVRELRQANEILRKASAYFAQAELDRRYKP